MSDEEILNLLSAASGLKVSSAHSKRFSAAEVISFSVFLILLRTTSYISCLSSTILPLKSVSEDLVSLSITSTQLLPRMGCIWK
ncbi:unnamed protein product [Trichobilharzia szidati]|nr:unnamed protein product [Trichobilharzia szidati]